MLFTQEYVNFQVKDGEDVINHIHSFKLLLEELATVGINYNEEDKVETLLASLPESYETRVQSLTNTEDLTIEDVISKILHEDLRRKKSGTSTSHSDVPTALWTQNRGKTNPSTWKELEPSPDQIVRQG
jgi:superfamily II helicase